MKRVTKDTLIGDALEMDREIGRFFLEIGMHCLGCPSARGETIEEACAVHDTDCDDLIANINEYLESKEK